MTSGVFSQLGVKDESTWGTAVVVDKFYEMVSENIVGNYARVESSSLRDSQRVQRSDRWARNSKGASGPVQLEVMSKGFGWWLKHMLGGVATTGPTETTAYTHTGTVASLTGDSFTLQVGRPDTTGAIRAFTYDGGKVVDWELSNSVDGMLMATLNCDFKSETTATGLATESYPTAMEVLNFTGGLVSIGGSATDVTDITIKGNNNLKTDRYFIKNSTTKKEQIEGPQREYSVSMTLEFDSLTQYNRVAAATNAAAMGDVIASWTGFDLAGATTIYPKLTATLNTVRFDTFGPAVQGPDIITATLDGRVLDDGDALTAVNLAYISKDVTP